MSSDRGKARLLLTRFGGDVEEAAQRLAAASEPVAAGRPTRLGGYEFVEEFELPTFKRGQRAAPRFDTFSVTVNSLDDPDGDGVEVIVSTERLGDGQYGFTNPGVFNGQDVAVKFIPFNPPEREDGKPVTPYTEEDFKREVKLATKAGDIGLGARIYASGIYTESAEKKFYILVQEKLNRIDEEDDEPKVLDLVKRLFFKANIYHRDTHSANVMQADDGGFRLIDFGKAVDLDDMSEDERPTFRSVIQDLIRIFVVDSFRWSVIRLNTEGLPLIEAQPGVDLDETDQAFVDRINEWVMENAFFIG